ncbi:MAG: hypothetical protein ABI693_14050 [Bryobacteraceae bacterium]
MVRRKAIGADNIYKLYEEEMPREHQFNQILTEAQPMVSAALG